MSEIKCNPKAVWGHYLPNAVLVGRVQVGERGADNRAVGGVDESPAGVFALLAVRMQLKAYPTFTPIASQRIHALVFAAVV